MMCDCNKNPLALGEGEQFLVVDNNNGENHLFSDKKGLETYLVDNVADPDRYGSDPLDDVAVYIVRREIKSERKVSYTFS